MTTRLVFPVLLLLAVYCGNAQQDAALNEISGNKQYEAWLMTQTDRLRVIGTGTVRHLYDDSISLATGKNTRVRVVSFPILNIDQIWLRPKGQKWTSALIGMGVGLTAGVVLGLAAGDDPECSGQCFFESTTAAEKALLAAVLLTPAGGAIGLAIGSAKIRIPIDRKKDRYLRVKDRLKAVPYSPQ